MKATMKRPRWTLGRVRFPIGWVKAYAARREAEQRTLAGLARGKDGRQLDLAV